MTRLRALWPDLVCVLAVCGVAIAQLWPGLSQGLSPPVTWDHGAHLGKAMLTEQELLPFVRGWTDRVELGVPLNTMYGLGGTLWLLLFRFVTFRALPWWQVYALAVAGFRCMVGLSVFRLARTHGAGRIGALIGGIVALADTGDHSEGGWFYDIEFGVWPMSLAMCLVVFGLAELPQALEGRRAASVRAALFLGVALIAHPFALPAMACVLPFLLLGRTLDGARVRDVLWRAAPIGLVAGLIGAFWFLPFLADRALLDDHGQLYASFDEIGEWIATGRFPLRAGPWEVVLVPLALLFGLFSRGPRRWLALAAVAAIIVSSRSWLSGAHALRFLPALGRIMYPRFMMITKPLLFALAGILVQELVTQARAALRIGRIRARIAVALAVLGMIPVSLGFGKALGTSVLDRHVTTSVERPDFQDVLAFGDYLRAVPRSPFFRVGYLDESSHFFQIAGALTGHGTHQLTPLVAETFGNVSDSRDADALHEMNVRYVVTLGGPPGVYGASASPVRRFGQVTLWELANWTGEQAWDPSGAHTPHVTAQQRDSVTIDPAGATRIVVRRAFDPGWAAEADGRDIPIRRRPVADSPRLKVMELALPPGAQRVVLHYRAWRAADLLGVLCFWLGVLGLVALGLPRERTATILPRLVARLTPRQRMIARRASWALVALLLAVALGRASLRYDFVLHTPVVSVRDPAGERFCTTPSEEGGVVCGPANVLRVGPTLQGVDGILHDCIWAMPQPGDLTTVVRYPDVRLAGHLHVGAGISDESQAGGRGAPVNVAAFVDAHRVTTLSVPNGRSWVERDVDVPSGVHEVRFEIHAIDANRRMLCFDAVSD